MGLCFLSIGGVVWLVGWVAGSGGVVVGEVGWWVWVWIMLRGVCGWFVLLLWGMCVLLVVIV